MPTLRTEERTDSEERVYGIRQKCPRCRRPILWLITYRNGCPAPFDPQPAQDTPDGWAPGMYTIGGRKRLCMLPRALHTPTTPPGGMLQIHHCLGAA